MSKKHVAFWRFLGPLGRYMFRSKYASFFPEGVAKMFSFISESVALKKNNSTELCSLEVN